MKDELQGLPIDIRLDGIGLSALIPGMVVAHRILGNAIAKFEAERAAINDKRRPGRPKKVQAKKSSWSSDPEERKAEMARRRAVATKNAKPKRTGNGWQNRTAKQKKAWMKAIQEGRKRAAAKAKPARATAKKKAATPREAMAA